MQGHLCGCRGKASLAQPPSPHIMHPSLQMMHPPPHITHPSWQKGKARLAPTTTTTSLQHRYNIRTIISLNGKGTNVLSHEFNLMAWLYSTFIFTNGVLAILASHSVPGFATRAGPFGPSKAIPAEFPFLSALSKCLTSLCPLLLEPLKTLYPKLCANFANLLPSLLWLIKTAIFLCLKAAKQAGKSWCHKPITAGARKGFSKRTRQERTKSFRIKLSTIYKV